MENLLFRYEILTLRGSGGDTIPAGHYLETYWDDIADNYKVYEYDSASDTSGTVRTLGPDLGSEPTRSGSRGGDFIVKSGATHGSRLEGRRSLYTFCDGQDLQTFIVQSTFPYVLKKSTVGHFSCKYAICDLIINSDYTVTMASDTTTNDGTITVSATSSNGVIKYSLDPLFDYATSGQYLGVFEDLYYGIYTVTAKDGLGCVQSVILEVKIPDFYNPKYRIEYNDRNHVSTRVDILQRGYVGAVIEICGGDDPFVNEFNSGSSLNKFTPVIPSSASISVISESNFYFRDLFTQDDRKYLIEQYKYSGITSPETITALNLSTGQQKGLTIFPSWSIGASLTVTLSNTASKNYYIQYDFIAGSQYEITLQSAISNNTTGIALISLRAHGIDVEYIELISENYFSVANGSQTDVINFTPTKNGKYLILLASKSGATKTFTVTSVSIKKLEDAVGRELKWTGYSLSSNYSEVYAAPPYEVGITATDGLADLQRYSFLDKDGNKFKGEITLLNTIVEILKKTDLKINIISCVNRYEEDMYGGITDDPLTQCTFDPSIFYNDEIENCLVVLEQVLKPFGARILMRNGKWIIYCIEESVHTFNYREFNYLGNYISNGTISDIVSIKNPLLSDGAAYSDRNHVLEIIPSYGIFYFIHKLLKNPSLLKSYSFEANDIEIHDGTPSFTNWNINILNTPGSEYGIKETKAFEGLFNFYFKPIAHAQAGINTNFLVLTSKTGYIEYDRTDAIEFRFDYAIILKSNNNVHAINPNWVKVKWMLRIGNYYLTENNSWTTDVNFKYNEIYVESFNDSHQFKIVTQLAEVSGLTYDSFQFEVVLCTERTLDYILESGVGSPLNSIPTINLNFGKRVKGRESYIPGRGVGLVSTNLYWSLINGDDVADGLTVVRPSDYDDDTNQKVWKLDLEINTARSSDRSSTYLDFPTPELLVSYVYLDNVVILHLPKGTTPPDNITIEKANNKNIRVSFEDEYLLNDIDITNINNSERTYKNYFKKLDGTPTQIWSRTYRPGSDKLLSLLSNDFASQHKGQSNKLTGSIIFDTPVTPSTILNEVFDGGRKYMFMGYELHDKRCSINFDLAELKDVVNDSTSTEIDAGYTPGFSLGFRS